MTRPGEAEVEPRNRGISLDRAVASSTSFASGRYAAMAAMALISIVMGALPVGNDETSRTTPSGSTDASRTAAANASASAGAGSSPWIKSHATSRNVRPSAISSIA